jgi:hypothetical protein
METVTGSFSEIDTARQCLHKHRLGYKERWRTERTSPALAKGTLWHLVLEQHYLSLKSTQKDPSTNLRYSPDHRLDLAVEAVKPLLFKPNSREPMDEVAELVAWMYTGYVHQWGIDQEWRILDVEYATEVWLPTAQGSRSRFKLKLKIDLVVRADQHIWVVDHKSGRNLPKRKQLDINDQFALYTWALRQEGHDVFGSLHNAARTQRNLDPSTQTLESRFERNRLTRTDAELDTVAVEAYRTLRNAWRIPIGEEPRSPNEDTCGWRCDYLEPCLFGRKGRDEQRMLEDLGFLQDFTRH